MSHLVAILTQEQYTEVEGQKYTDDSYFNPLMDCNSNWVVSVEEIDQITFRQFDWLKTLPLIDYCFPTSGDTLNHL